MYGWKRCGSGGGGIANNKLWIYGKETSYSTLIKRQGNRALYPDYTMEERTDLYDCGKTDFFVLPTGLRGYNHNFSNFKTEFSTPHVDCVINNEYQQDCIPGSCYLVGYFIKVSKTNTNIPMNKGYETMFPGGALEQSVAGQNQCVDVLNKLWNAKVPGYNNVGSIAQYKNGNFWRASGFINSDEEEEETTITGGVYPNLSPSVNSITRQIVPLIPYLWHFFYDKVEIYYSGNTQNYMPYKNNIDLWSDIAYINTLPNADVFVRGLNKWLLDVAVNKVLVAQDENYKYYAYGFSVLGA